MKKWLRRLLLIGLLAAAAAWLAKSQQPQRPPLSVVPTPPEPPQPRRAPEPQPDHKAQPDSDDADPDEADDSVRGFGGFAAFSSPGTVVAGEHPGSVRALASGAAPGPEYTIKGNADSMIFHTPDSPSYERTVAEVWFASEDEALAAGFRAPKRRGRSSDD